MATSSFGSATIGGTASTTSWLANTTTAGGFTTVKEIARLRYTIGGGCGAALIGTTTTLSEVSTPNGDPVQPGSSAARTRTSTSSRQDGRKPGAGPAPNSWRYAREPPDGEPPSGALGPLTNSLGETDELAQATCPVASGRVVRGPLVAAGCTRDDTLAPVDNGAEARRLNKALAVGLKLRRSTRPSAARSPFRSRRMP